MKYRAKGKLSRRRATPLICAAALSLLGWAGSVLAASDSSVADSGAASEVLVVENQVNINTADAAELALALDGVGMTRAEDIIAYREQHGDFESVDALAQVRGIGPATLERNRERIVLVDTQE